MPRSSMPNDVEAELAVIGAILLRGGDVLDRVELEARHFYDPRCQAAFEAMTRLHATGRPVNDPLLVVNQAGSKASAMGGMGFLSDALEGVPSADNAEFYADRIRNRWLLREVIIAGSEIAATKSEDGEGVIAAALERFSKLGEQRKETAQTMRELALAQVREFDQACDHGPPEDREHFLLTGLNDFDSQTGGLELGTVSIMAARTSMGKSAMARTFADGVAARGAGVHTFTMEDPKRTLAMRAFSEHSRIPLTKLRALKLDKQDHAPIHKAADSLYKRDNWLIDDEAGLSTAQIAMRVRRSKRRLGTKLVVVDYLQHIREPGVRDDFSEATQAMRNLVRLARSEDVHVMLVCQLNRDCEKREDKRPVASDLRQSGRLEEDARMVLMLYRDDYYDKQMNPGLAELLIRKSSNGATGTVDLKWDGPCVTYRPAYRGVDFADFTRRTDV